MTTQLEQYKETEGVGTLKEALLAMIDTGEPLITPVLEESLTSRDTVQSMRDKLGKMLSELTADVSAGPSSTKSKLVESVRSREREEEQNLDLEFVEAGYMRPRGPEAIEENRQMDAQSGCAVTRDMLIGEIQDLLQGVLAEQEEEKA